MIKNTKYFISLLLMGCLLAEPKETNVIVNSQRFDWNLEKPLKIENKYLSINIYSNDENNIILKNLLRRIPMSQENETINFITENYQVVLVEISNKTAENKTFSISKLEIINNDNRLSPVIPKDIAKDFEKIDKKGIAKNIYNSINFLILISAIVVVLTVITMGKGAASAPIQISGTPETDKFWSNIYKKYNITYNDLINENNELKPNSKKIGIFFIRKENSENINQLRFRYLD